ncbi:hypothetical protein Tco_1024131 [Tanacetum coccineum]
MGYQRSVQVSAKVSKTQIMGKILSLLLYLDYQDSPDNEEDTRSSHEYLNDLEEEYQARAFLAKSKSSSKRVLKGLAVHKQLTKLNATNVARSSSSGKNKGLIAEAYDWDDEEVLSDENKVTKVKALMALTD